MLRIALTLVADGHHVVLQVLHDVHRRELFAGQVRRADIGAAAAYGAGVSVQQLLPGKVLHAPRAEFLGVFQVYEGKGALGLQGPEEGVHRSSEHMHMLGVRDIDGEYQDDRQVSPPKNALQDVGGAGTQTQVSEQTAQGGADEDVSLGAGPSLRHPESVGQYGGQHQPADEDDYDQGVGVTGQIESKTARFQYPSADECPDQHCEQDGGQDVQVAAVDPDPGLSEQPFGEPPPR